MKQLHLSSSSFLYLEQAFKEWLDVLGFSSQTVYQLPIHIRELFYYLEQQSVKDINQVDSLQEKNN